MWPFKKQRRFNPRAPVDWQGLVRSYLSYLPDEGGWDDEEILQQMMANGHPEQASWIIIGLVSSYAGRLLLADLGPKVSDQITLYFPDGKMDNYELLDFPPFLAILHEREAIQSHGNFKHLALGSSEAQGVNELMQGGSDPKDLVLTPTALLMRG